MQEDGCLNSGECPLETNVTLDFLSRLQLGELHVTGVKRLGCAIGDSQLVKVGYGRLRVFRLWVCSGLIDISE